MRLNKQIRDILFSIVYFLALLFYAVCRRSLPKKSSHLHGINFIGYYAGELGLGQALRNAVYAAKKVHIPFGVRELTVNILSRQEDVSIKSYLEPYASYPLNCICMNPDMLYRLPTWLSYAEWTKRYNVGYWFWELNTFPSSWRYARYLIDEVWVNTDFVADAVAGLGKPVYKIPFAIEFPVADSEWTRSDFALPDGAFIFLFSFDFNSFIARKNPQAVVCAFQSAFPLGTEAVNLVLKSSNGLRHPDQRQALDVCINGDSRILVLDEQYTNERMRGLLGLADCYVSLHRSEGLGLGLAESMYLGKPVIGTAYSGNLEFMNSDNAVLVPYDLISVQSGQYPFSDQQVWAEPNINEAALSMRRMFSDPAYCNQLGSNAARYMREHHSFARMGQAMQARISAIELQLPN